MRVIVIGGGVIGLCTAYYLRKAGHELTVIDRNDVTDGCSFGNMGYISPSHFIPLASPGIVAQGLKWMLRSSSPFYIKPRLNWDLLRWGMIFWRNATPKKVERNAPRLNNLLQLTRHLMNDLKMELADPFDMTERGCWMLYKSEKTGDHEKHLAEQAAAYGLKTRICSAAQVQELETEVEVNVSGGILYLDDCHVNPSRFMRSIYQSLRGAGVNFQLRSEVRGFEKNRGALSALITNNGKLEGDEIVIANGSWLGELSKKLGIRMPMQPGKGYSVAYDGLQKNLQHPSILVDDRTATTPIHQWLRIGGTMELSGHSDNILPKRVMAIYKAFSKYYPSMHLPEPDLKKAWFGYRPVTPDGLPYIGRHNRYPNLIYAGGHAMLGMSAAAGTGLLVKEIIGREKPAIDLSAFDPCRFG